MHCDWLPAVLTVDVVLCIKRAMAAGFEVREYLDLFLQAKFLAKKGKFWNLKFRRHKVDKVYLTEARLN